MSSALAAIASKQAAGWERKKQTVAVVANRQWQILYMLYILYILGNRSNIGIYYTILYRILERLGLPAADALWPRPAAGPGPAWESDWRWG